MAIGNGYFLANIISLFIQYKFPMVFQTAMPIRYHAVQDSPQDFQKFVAEIRELWISGGLIVDDLNANPNHHDPNYGPNLYQVNEQYVKLGGTGKLKRQCQVFFFGKREIWTCWMIFFFESKL